MKRVVVLVDNESRTLPTIQNFGWEHENTLMPGLCRMGQLTKIFTYEVFGLMTIDKKLTNFIRSMNGLTIVVDGYRIKPQILQRIEELTVKLTDIPILYLVQNSTPMIQDMFQKLLKHPNVKYHSYNGTHSINYRKPDNRIDGITWFNQQIVSGVSKPKKQILNSQTISTVILVKKFQDATLSLDLWDHYGRLRIVYYALMKNGYKKTIDPNGWLCQTWIKYKTSIGHKKLWHYTLTRFWVNIIYELQTKNRYRTFDELYKDNSYIHAGSLFKQYYTPEVIFTQKARTEWIPPNKNKSNIDQIKKLNPMVQTPH